jgi:copper resistance protein B
MKRILIAGLVAAAAPALAQHAGHGAGAPQPDPHAGHDMGAAAPAAPPATTDPHAGHDMKAMRPAALATASDPHAGRQMGGQADSTSEPLKAPPPAAAFEGPRHAADTAFDPSAMAASREQLRAEQGGMRTYKVLVDQLEMRIGEGRDGYRWDAEGWYGADIDKLWVKTEGEGGFSRKPEAVEVQALWSHAITPWFDAQAGVRYDFRPDPERTHLVLGLQGLAPYYFEVDGAAFLSDEGDVTARLEAEYDQLITQKLILQPRAEVSVSAQTIREIGVGSGFTNIEAGIRLRYEFTPEFAPYIGVEYERSLGETADFARDEGEDVGVLHFLVGIRTWF